MEAAAERRENCAVEDQYLQRSKNHIKGEGVEAQKVRHPEAGSDAEDRTAKQVNRDHSEQ